MSTFSGELHPATTALPNSTFTPSPLHRNSKSES